ncbi:MAG: hypothetical protein KYX62_16475 [Pseudomonadota bacterium]|nr:hypothetical protein [Pseudomonadota bacterium]
MEVVFAYQSLNSSSRLDHGLSASTRQRFQRSAHNMLSRKYPAQGGALRYPYSEVVPGDEALQGPAELLPLAGEGYLQRNPKKRRRSDDDDDPGPQHKKRKLLSAEDEMLSMVQGKARNIYQLAHRVFGLKCSLIVLGELDSGHQDWEAISAAAGDRIHSSVQAKACQCFSSHSFTPDSQFVAEGVGWCAFRCSGVLAVFVHVPNAQAKSVTSGKKFYQDIKNVLLQAQNGGVADVVMGDTNQSRDSFSAEVISAGTGWDFLDGHASGREITTPDTFSPQALSHGGTNSADSKKYDVALYNTDTVKNLTVEYISRLSFLPQSSAAYTDHMGLLVKVEKKSGEG